MDSIFEPFLLSLVAGMATGLGGMIVLMLRRVGDRVVSFSMGFASGVMLMVAFNNLFLEAEKLLAHVELIVVFSLGAVMMIILDLSIPHIELATGKLDSKKTKMRRTGILIAIGITLHNIPKGVATAIPFRKAGTKPLKIAIVTLLSGLAEPLAALVGAVALSAVGTRTVVGYSLVFAAGVMTYITADELIPVAHEYGYKHTVSVGLLLGTMFALMVDVIPS
jgi:ZIP family zinc transporter